MGEVTTILSAIDAGDEHAAENLLPLVYQELRTLAAARMAHEQAGHSLQPTMLVHEAYLRLVDVNQRQHWNSRGHFFGAAAEAMRRILVERARQKRSIKRGGKFQRFELNESVGAVEDAANDFLALDEALTRFEQKWPDRARLVKLRYFAGLTVPEVSKALGISTATAERYWSFSRAWLHAQLKDDE